MSVFLEIIIMLFILGVLVSIHEAGHLATAKLFKVYCFEYSIGMGPALLKKKKKGGETYFCIRSIPFGGYVSMFGEAENVQLEEGETLPDPSRSIEAIAKWKKIIILFAGVFLNFLLGLLLIFISVSCFSRFYFGNAYISEISNEASLVFAPVITEDDEYTKSKILEYKNPNYEVEDYDLFLGFSTYNDLLDEPNDAIQAVVATDVKIENYSGTYVAVYSPSILTKEHSLLNDLYFFEPYANVSVPEKYKEVGITSIPKINETASNYFQIEDRTVNLSLTLRFCPVRKAVEGEPFDIAKNMVTVTYDAISLNKLSKTGLDLSVDVISHKNNLKEATEDWCYYVPVCTTAILKGLVSLFSIKGISNLSGIVGMTAMVGTYSAMGGVSMLFLFAGLISINLAIFNLLPFPGLDGYQIVVTAIEGITKKKVPAKLKSILSFAGLAILFGLMILVTIKDIITLF